MGDSKPKPLITTIIPTFRRPRLLRRAIKSVLAQTYSNIRLCVYDNASGDETPEVVAELANANPQIQIEYHRHAKNIGPFKNFLYGIRLVGTPFFSTFSDDDVLLPTFYEVALKGFEKHPGAWFSATGSLIMDEAGTVKYIPILKWEPGYYAPPDGLLTMCKNSHPIWTSILYRREVVQLFRSMPETFEDKYVGLMIASHHPFVITHDPGAILVAAPSTFTQLNRSDLFMIPILESFMRDLDTNNKLDVTIRDNCKRILINDILYQTLLEGLVAISRNNYSMVEPANYVLRRYSDTDLKSLLFSVLLLSCKSIPLARYFLDFFFRIMKKVIAFRNRHLQTTYGHFAKYLQL